MRARSRLTDDYVHGKSPLDTHRLARLDDDLYWNDGQMRGEVYNWGSFVQSKMYAQGVTCSDCHDPHSLKLKADGNAVCAQCHQPAKYDAPAHTHHAAGTPGAACAELPHADDDVHGGRSAPRPLAAHPATGSVSAARHAERVHELSREEDRAVGGRCDRDVDRQAAGELPAVRRGAACWFGRRDRARAKRWSRSIDDQRNRRLRAPARSNGSADLLTPRSTDAVVHALNDPDASVRHAAVEALANVDPDCATRVAAVAERRRARGAHRSARALAGAPERSLTMEQRTRFNTALAEYVAAQTYNFDRPEGHMNIGNLAAMRGDARRRSHSISKRSNSIRCSSRRMSISPMCIAPSARKSTLRLFSGKA